MYKRGSVLLQLLISVFYFTIHIASAQSAIVVENSFQEINLTNFMSHYHDLEKEVNPKNILSKAFNSNHKELHGLKKTKVWFQFRIRNPHSKNKKLILSCKTNAIFKMQLYKQDADSLIKIKHQPVTNNKNMEIEISVAKNETSSYFIEVFFRQSTFFPIKIFSPERKTEVDKRYLIFDLLFYCLAVIALFVNLTFYLSTKNRFFIYYCLLLSAITLTILDTQGIIFSIIDKPEWKFYIKLTINLYFVAAGYLFSLVALQLPKYYPKYERNGKIFVGFFALTLILFLITGNIRWYSLGKILLLAGILLFWVYGLLLSRKSIYARFYTLAYSSLLISMIIWMLSLRTGIFHIYYVEQFFQFGAGIEILVFLIAIAYRHKETVKDKQLFKSAFLKTSKKLSQLEEELSLLRNEKNEDYQNQVYWFVQKYDLNERETQVLHGVLKGQKNKEIAQTIFLSLSSVKQYCARIFEKTNVKNRAQLIALFSKNGSA